MEVDKKAWNIEISNNFLMEYVVNLINIIAYKSIATAEHCIRVAEIALDIGRTYKLSSKDMEDLFVASMLHDVGKVFIPTEILNKSCKLTEKEYESMKEHSKIGCNILSKNIYLQNASNIILHHHERYDGTGYPYGLKGNEIPFLSRIISIADSFDAMISERSYKTPMSIDEAAYEIEKNKNIQFDEEIASVFFVNLLKDVNQNNNERWT